MAIDHGAPLQISRWIRDRKEQHWNINPPGTTVPEGLKSKIKQNDKYRGQTFTKTLYASSLFKCWSYQLRNCRQISHNPRTAQGRPSPLASGGNVPPTRMFSPFPFLPSHLPFLLLTVLSNFPFRPSPFSALPFLRSVFFLFFPIPLSLQLKVGPLESS